MEKFSLQVGRAISPAKSPYCEITSECHMTFDMFFFSLRSVSNVLRVRSCRVVEHEGVSNILGSM